MIFAKHTAILFSLSLAACSTSSKNLYYSPLSAIPVSPSGAASFLTVTPMSSPNTAVKISTNKQVTDEENQWITLGLPAPDLKIKGVRVCYKVEAASPGTTYISQIRLSTMTTPDASLVVHDDPTNLTAVTSTCYTSMTPTIQVNGAISLEMKFVFENRSDVIRLGEVALLTHLMGRGNPGVTLAAGGFTTCALTTEGNAKCWGKNDQGQLGDGTTVDENKPVPVTNSSGLSKLNVGLYHVCTVSISGGVGCWGGNKEGQLGDGSKEDRHSFVAAKGFSNDITDVAVGGAEGSVHTCALSGSTGKIQCLGSNQYGQLGDGTQSSRGAPVTVVNLSGALSVVAGAYHTCALTNTHGVVCWGGNSLNQLGVGTITDSSIPVEVRGLSSGVKSLSAGYSHTCALTEIQGVKCWGSNGFGQLGSGAISNSPIPLSVVGLGKGVIAIATGAYHACALTQAETVKCWGRNNKGQLGDGTRIDKYSQVDVRKVSGAKWVSVGSEHSCVLTVAGIQCWGDNTYGQLGDGTTKTSDRPVRTLDF